MIIPITLSTDGICNPKLPHGLAKIANDEIVLVELQGSLDVEAKHPSERNGKLVGKLSIDEGSNKPTLRIGHHLLEGKIATINKPLAILHRSHANASTSTGAMAVDEEESQVGESQTGDVAPWVILGVVRKKIVFSKRPMPLAKPK
ncbi:hypothetical protein CC1G_07097 [Coprinopsis cinerea okayama7|uniref:Chromosome transmission fidelity protein 8 n=1 Tax=Coprinopsis cinerea (strain Okayama-7 / 130 / ATCC MYA-4618 / FGSC 9003) TaxID=240176 RepID=A8NUG3_COPC7|nr:hypothetical protein CC1G_07097 [Coprinopsis cinerea okayama7\|eukprot:XP_001836450.1 hypothetical protein CC1G_07097 [Coprinopsis cinerea okayama7\